MEEKAKEKEFVKVRFVGPSGSTAGLVVDALVVAKSSISDLSRLFPYTESAKMARLEVSEPYPTSTDAFGHDFNLGLKRQDNASVPRQRI